MVKLHDTATGSVKELELRRDGEVSMYVCGPTVYGLPHLGHGRFALTFDILRRYLIFCGLNVVYVSNITDIDDKIIMRANAEGKTCDEIAHFYEEKWWESMDALSVLRPTYAPHALDYVEGMVDLIGKLFNIDAAYETSDGLYLDVSKVEGYGLLAHQDISSLKSGARVEIDSNKRSAVDFALWKFAKPGEPVWPSPWGNGRPGWHTECVVMSLDLLGEGFDIHGGAQDLIFPHHENERAQAVVLGRDFAKHWVHNGWVTVEGEKMSKSLDNYTTLPELLSHHDPRAFRLLVLRSHYRSPIEVTPETLTDSEAALGRLDAFVRRVLGEVKENSQVENVSDKVALLHLENFKAAMDNDLDTPGATAQIFECISRGHVMLDQNSYEKAWSYYLAVCEMADAVGLERKSFSDRIDQKTMETIAARDQARSQRDYALADKLRDELVSMGWSVEDAPTGTRVHRS